MNISISDPKGERNLVLSVLAAALLLRLGYAFLAQAVPPVTDMVLYDSARLAFLNNAPYTADWPPLYPLFLAAVTRLFGEGYFILYAAQAVLSTLTCLLIYLASREAFDKRAGLAALLVSAAYIDSVWYSAVLMAETLGLLLLTGAVYLLLKREGRLLAGLVFGLACLTKGVYLITLPAVFAWEAARHGLKKGAVNSLKFGAVSLLLILPWTIRNYRAHKAFVLLEPHIGMSMFLGHNPSATGGCDYYFSAYDYGKFFEDPALTVTQKDKIARDYAIKYILENPGRELQLFLLKLSKYWSFRTHFDMNNFPYPLRKWLFLGSLATNMLLFPALVFGIAFSAGNRKALLFIFITAAYTLAFTGPFSAFGRMRFPLVPFIIALAAHGALLLPGLLARIKAGETAGIRGPLAAGAIASLLLFANFAYQVLTRLGDVAGRFN